MNLKNRSKGNGIFLLLILSLRCRYHQVHVKAISWRFKSSYPHHAGAKFVLLRLIFLKNKPCVRSLAAPLSQKGTFPSAIRLQANAYAFGSLFTFVRYLYASLTLKSLILLRLQISHVKIPAPV